MLLNDPEARMMEIAQDDFNIVVGAAHKGASIILTPDGTVLYVFAPSTLCERLYEVALHITYQTESHHHHEALAEMEQLLPPPVNEGYQDDD